MMSWNEATEFINPTKALEYMAAGRPVVSTARDEVRTNFGSISRVAGTRADFIIECHQEVVSPTTSRIRRGLKLAAENTWEAIATKMEAHIQDVLAPSRVVALAAYDSPPLQTTGGALRLCLII